jgi:hypothetical protein
MVEPSGPLPELLELPDVPPEEIAAQPDKSKAGSRKIVLNFFIIILPPVYRKYLRVVLIRSTLCSLRDSIRLKIFCQIL